MNLKNKSFIALLILFFSTKAIAQFDPELKFYPELSAGLKAGIGEVQYGPRFGEITSSANPVFQPTIRYDLPVRLWTINENTFWLNISASSGVLYVPVKKHKIENIDPVTGDPVSYYSKSPLYLPLYIGFYNSGPFGLGVEAFYAKGLNGISDIWGGKILGITYNHTKFRLNAAYEMAVPVKFKVDNPIRYFSLEFLWKLGRREEY